MDIFELTLRLVAQWPYFNERIASTCSELLSLNNISLQLPRSAEIEKRRPAVAASRAQAILNKIMIRRNKHSELNGTRLITLPAKHIEDVAIELSPEERTIYDVIQNKAQQQFNKVKLRLSVPL